MGTSGMTSQAYGQHNLNEITRLLLRSVGVGLFIALCLLILQYPILKLAFTLIQTTPEVEQLATTYFYICIWGAPATLGLYGFAGLVYRNAEFTLSHVYRYYSKHCQYCSQPILCLLAGYESGRSGNRNFNSPICRFLHGHIAIYALL